MNAYLMLGNNFKTATYCNDNEECFYTNDLTELILELSSKRYDTVYVWHAPEIFALLDSYAINNNLEDYEQLALNSKGYKPRVENECISRRDSDSGYYQRKIWLKTKKFGSTDRHKRLFGTSYINIKNFFGSINFESACSAFDIKNNINSAIALKELIYKFSSSIREISGIELFDNGHMNYWTMGGISKSYYLNLFKIHFPMGYRNYSIHNEEFEIEMRLTHLLHKGILYCKQFNKEYRDYYKVDKNSLFPSVSRYCPLFTNVKKSSWEEYSAAFRVNYKFIIVFNRLVLEVKPEYPNVLQAPGEKCTDRNSNIIEYTNQSFFNEHFETLLKIYNVIDIDIKAVYKLRTQKDPVICYYNQSLFNLKKSLNNNIPLRTIIKYFLNNLHGKYAQISLQPKFEYTKDNNGILTRRIKSLKNTWSKTHFDYIRGAYIYSMAQRDMLEELIRLPKPLEVAYIDTDCFVVKGNNLPLPLFIGAELGEFKIENVYKKIMFYAPKNYIGITRAGLEVTCAGMQSTEIKEFLLIRFNADINLSDIINLELPSTFTRRTKNGFERVKEFRKLGRGLTDKEVLAGGYIIGTDN